MAVCKIGGSARVTTLARRADSAALPPMIIGKESVAHRPRRQPESRDAHAAHLRRSPLESAASQREASDHAPSIDPRSDRARGGWWRHWRKCTSSGRGSAICVQSLDDSLNSAIRTTYRISLRSSSLLMPRYPSTRVV